MSNPVYVHVPFNNRWLLALGFLDLAMKVIFCGGVTVTTEKYIIIVHPTKKDDSSSSLNA